MIKIVEEQVTSASGKNAIISGLLLLFAVSLGGFLIAFSNTQQSVQIASAVSDWGVQFSDNGGTPNGNEKQEVLHEFNSYFVGDESQKGIYLTFNTGNEVQGLDNILEVLEKHEVCATFFVTGVFLQNYPEYAERIADAGHIIGNSTATYNNVVDMLTMDKFQTELASFEEEYFTLFGVDCEKIYRPPHGKYSLQNVRHASELGYSTIFWSLSFDESSSIFSQQDLISSMTSKTHNGAILSLDSSLQRSNDILEELIVQHKNAGYTFCSLGELLEITN